MGYKPIDTSENTVVVRGNMRDVMRLNLYLRTAHRVLVPLLRTTCRNIRDLYHATYSIDWENLIEPDGYFSVSSVVHNMTIRDTRIPSLYTKDAIADRMRDKCQRRPDSGGENIGAAIFVYWERDEVIIYLDTSGEPLSKRGYRRIPGSAPMQETLAAACIMAMGWEGKTPFISYNYEIYGDFDGVCNPSLVNVNGQANILLFFSYASERVTESRFIEAKLDNLDAPVVSGSISVPHQGLPLDGLEWATIINADFGYDRESGKIYIVKDGMVFAAQNAKRATLVQLAEIPMVDLYKQTATWTNIASVYAIELGGYTRVHSAALVTNGNAEMVDGVSIVFTSSVAASDVTDTSYIFKSGLHYYNVVGGEEA